MVHDPGLILLLITRTAPIPITDLLELIKPMGALKNANSLAHDITYDDIWLAIMLMKEANFADGERWEKLAALVTDNVVAATWESNNDCIKSVCQDKRDR